MCKQEEFFLLTPPTKMELTWRSETSAHKIQMPGNDPKERIQHSGYSESLKSLTVFPIIIASITCNIQEADVGMEKPKLKKQKWELGCINP